MEIDGIREIRHSWSMRCPSTIRSLFATRPRWSWLVPALGLAVVPAFAEDRTWTSTDGKTVTGSIIALEGHEISLQSGDKVFKFPLTRLSQADQDFATKWKADAEKEMAESASFLGDFRDLTPGLWPTDVSAEFEVDAIEVVKEDEAAKLYIYRSPHFEFESPLRLSTSVVREFARIFEASFEFAKIIPLGLNPQPSAGGYYKTKLYQSKEDYYVDGGMQGSGGMHTYSYRGDEILTSLIKVPLSNLGVEYTGTRYIVDHKKQSAVLVHEIGHQITGRWLPVLPTWVKEGLAEFISVQPYDNGRFRLTQLDRAIRDDVARMSGSDKEFQMIGVERLMKISGDEWASELASGRGSINYCSANVLFYYFLRLDGEGKGERLIDYLKAISAGTPEETARDEKLLAGRSFEALEQAVAEAWRGSGLRLTFTSAN